MITKLMRYLLATVGPVGSAAAQFFLSLILLHSLSASDFGRYAFLQVVLQLSLGIWGALFCSPLPAILAKRPSGEHGTITLCLTGANGLAAGMLLVLFVCVALLTGTDFHTALLYGTCGGMTNLRWYARAQAYATGRLQMPVASDAIYVAVLMCGILMLVLRGSGDLADAFGLLLVASALSMIAFGWKYLSQQFASNPLRGLRDYYPVWRQHARWSLMGVITTEATANAHVYIVTLAVGPTAYAPIAASALLIRPVQVAMNALSDLERAQMARNIADRRDDLVKSAIRLFRGALGAVWMATLVLVIAMFSWAPHLVFPTQYDKSTLAVASTLWLIVAGIRLLRTPESVFLQAAGEFRSLASASFFSAVASVVTVCALVASFGPLWSIVGITMGEVIFALCIRRRATNRFEFSKP